MKEHQTSIFDQALSLLSHREHSKQELVTKLKTKGHEEEEISATIERLEEMNYLNDERFAEIFVRSRLSKPLGASRIQQELIQKGINSELAKTALSEANADWFELAKQLKERRFGEEISTDFKEKAKQSRYLQYRGFDFEQIKYAVSSQD
ncbi:MAG: recombination regulator RecX [Gammaproteobacteria bacterium]|uniref:recombination regulator RecX n=1 Tax=unclassified Marinomonas TaxID=196814 RepID=UPI000C1F5F23|nr:MULTISPECIES: recombination regulator RecX [unclassified Marinomonas]MBU1293955.1 recombination regulator RecX [Gammaproteobacteria bacterium]MBU1467575.1 recombination regulator RecX [Gammaproteobacteria bacterium]MBU2022285.1 recombination regulator RecX [Gammaproteobacteria bacterium]MBU2238800.1 recombination regulator RecX [Gammaproteobacteria bacterium]MBU2317039.1 recombination regulator RecX [Gammaproteobacteria bacterium]